HSWPAAIVFGAAAITDQIDGFLARRWRVESQFGKVADPLADRLMIDAAVILLWHAGRLPWVALVIPARDLALVAGYRPVGKPCMEHSLELVRDHGFEDVIVTVAFLPQAIRSYFGSGESLDLAIEYSVEESPLGTAGSVRLADDRLDDTFLVISGDALCDIDLGELVSFHREKQAAVTIGLKSVDNPLEFGIVVTDEDGRVERFLEKPSW